MMMNVRACSRHGDRHQPTWTADAHRGWMHCYKDGGWQKEKYALKGIVSLIFWW